MNVLRVMRTRCEPERPAPALTRYFSNASASSALVLAEA